MHGQDTARIPLYARDGSIRGYTIVDAADADFVSQWTWHLSGGYATRYETIGGTRVTILLHRALLGLIRGDRLEGDHVDRDRLNNRRKNLRVLTKAANSQNQSKPRRDTYSQYRGVYRASRPAGKWFARIVVNRKVIHLGTFGSEIDAANAAREGRRRLMPYATD